MYVCTSKEKKQLHRIGRIICENQALIMPTIVIKDYQWRQTEKKIIIYTPLRGCPKNMDLFVMDNYVKVFFSLCLSLND